MSALMLRASPSSRGLGHRVFIPATRVRIPLEMPFFLSFFSKNRYAIPAKSNSGLWQISFARPEFFFLLCYFLRCKKWDCSLSVGLPCASCPAGCDARARRRGAPPSNPDLYQIRLSTTIGSARHLAAARLPPRIVTQSLQKASNSLANKFARCCFFFLLCYFFAFAKNGIAHFP